MKRTQLKRGTKTMKRGTLRKVSPNKVKPKRELLPSVKTTKKKADKLLTPIIKLMYPLCLLCNSPTEVAHHHVHKSKSSRLRYEIDNLVNLCHRCHLRLHHNESYWASKVVEMRGIVWFKKIDLTKDQQVKTDVHFYLSHYKRLKAMKDELDAMN